MSARPASHQHSADQEIANIAAVDEEQHEIDDKEDLTNAAMQEVTLPPNIANSLISRDFVMHFKGSFNDLHNSPDLATWTVPEDMQAIFQSRTRWAPNCKKAAERSGDLSKVIMVKMAIKKVDSSFPCSIALTIAGARGNVYAANGDQFCYCAMPNERQHTMDKVVLTTSAFVNSEYMRIYPGMTSDKLRTEKIMKPPGQSYTYVAHDHPVIEMIAENAETLQVNLDDAELIDGQWYKISNSVAERCLSELETELVDNLPITDMRDFRATIHRMDGVGWSSPEEVCDNVGQPLWPRLMDTKRRFTAVVNLTYAFMG